MLTVSAEFHEVTTLDDLKHEATAKPIEGADTSTTLSLNDETEVNEAIHALGRFFAEDDRHTAVQLDVQSKKVGYLNRRDFLNEKRRSKLAQAESGQLPGEPVFKLIRLACPVESCARLVLKIHYDEGHPERCPVHPDQILGVCE